MSHGRWETVVRHDDPQLHNVQLAYVDGYVLALEDVLSDMSMMAKEDMSPAVRVRMWEVRRKIVATLRSARVTKKKLLERGTMTFVCERCKEQRHEDCPGGTYCDCSHRRG